MNAEYHAKFEEMKKYIPFLENMISRLESTSSASSNPRQAQLDKIRSLRDLLSNTKKRMKMENLVKCEQVLVNLYAKVEQRDTLSVDQKTDSTFSIETLTMKEKSDLEAVRNKLKTVVKQQNNVQDTLPEILTRSEVNDDQTSGTKEPALFQRRPNQQQNPGENDRDEKTSPPGSASKRNYTRVLVSPESSPRRWSASHPSDKPLYSRRSPRSSPRRHSPTYHKRERKKSKESTKQSRKHKDFNITLNVPEESLNSLNTKDILSRIINCSNNDVDIDTLRELRKQILGELKNTGANDDISDLILKSYQKKKTNEPKDKEVEEGELSDSESEAIESIYGSLVVKEPGQIKSSLNKDSQGHKIQICLVLNSEDMPRSKTSQVPNQDAELEMYEKEEKNLSPTEYNKTTDLCTKNNNDVTNESSMSDDKVTFANANISNNSALESEPIIPKLLTPPIIKTTDTKLHTIDNDKKSDVNSVVPSEENILQSEESVQFKANFYKPMMDQSNSNVADSGKITETTPANTKKGVDKKISNFDSLLKQTEKSTEIPLLHDRTVETKPPASTLSEIDILQALKNEILSDISVPGTETTTPPLHQPKVIKVASAQEIMPKKRISIEKYKQKSVMSAKLSLDKITFKDDQIKKTSLKLTDKECERFFNVPKISFDEEDESLEENDDDIEAINIYDDLAPKSPDHEDANNIDSVPPIIIPVDPVKTIPVNYNGDVDMRTLPISSPKNTNPTTTYNHNIGTSSKNDIPFENQRVDHNIGQVNNHNRPMLVDPRVRDINTNVSNMSPKALLPNPERTPRHNNQMAANGRTYEMTPTRQSIETDNSNNKHVYVPSMSYYDIREREKSVTKEVRAWEDSNSIGPRRAWMEDVADTSCWHPVREASSHQNARFTENREDLFDRSDCSSLGRKDVSVTSTQSLLPFGRECPTTNYPYGRLECPPTPTHSFGRLECPPTPSHSFGRLECPPTPSHSFGRLECPPTPTHSFGRLECPPTPTHSFGRLECPPTPSHPFGRVECPATPTHPFGRVECPPTPNHAFGRGDCPPTPSHPFGRNDGPSPHIFSLMDCPTPSSPYVGTDCLPTPTTLFGRTECPSTPSHTFSPSDCTPPQNQLYSYERPQTPSHHFSRSDTIKNQFSRPDYNTKKYHKDPRLNRNPESELKSQVDEKDRGLYRDRDRYHGNSYTSHKIYTGSDTYRGYDKEKSVSRNNKYKYYGPEYQSRRERSLGRSSSKDSEKDRVHSKDIRYNKDVRNSEDTRSSHDYYKEKNVGRTVPPSDTQASTRTHSLNRNLPRDSNRNKLSVTSTIGPSFTIDTSINATFQKIIDSAKEIQGYVNSFDARRQRATSVGRTLARESSVGKTTTQSTNSETNKHENKKQDFRRASSVGREVLDTDNRSFQEIKDEFIKCSFSAKQSDNSQKVESLKKHKNKETEYTGRSRKDIYEKHKSDRNMRHSKNSSYSPKRNYRDPRMRRRFDKKYDNYSPDTYNRKSGIVYSNDNIITGSILASGYGVKNYKIPKIKRNTEEKEVMSETKETVDKGIKTVNDDNIVKKQDKIEVEKVVNDQHKGKQKIQDFTKDDFTEDITLEGNQQTTTLDVLNEEIDSKQTSDTSPNLIVANKDTEMMAKPKKFKRVIYDSDSDIETDTGDFKEDYSQSRPVKHKNCKHLDSSHLNTSFGIDELEIFNDNTALDPVIDNINALIADLDSDINTSKNDLSHKFTKEISVENMMENISSPEKKYSESQCDNGPAKILDAIDDVSNEHVQFLETDKTRNDVNNTVTLNSLQKIQEENCDPASGEEASVEIDTEGQHSPKDFVETAPTQSDEVQNEKKENLPTFISTSIVKCTTDDIDSTTEMEKGVNQIEDKSSVSEIRDACSTPDSTINTDDAIQKSSDEEVSSGNTHEVTSTDTIEPKSSISMKETAPALDSLGSLLSILDKSKIKELLNMLDDNSIENEKIKKKLEKLSEIVSDDEETSNEQPTKVTKSKKEECNDSENVYNQERETDKNVQNVSNNPVGDGYISIEDNKFEQNKPAETIDTPETDTNIGKKEIKNKRKPAKRKSKNIRKFKGKARKLPQVTVKRITRASAPEVKQKVKKPLRELLQLQEDIKGMFIRDEVLSATGIRMCRLAKLVDTNTNTSAVKEDMVLPESEPLVVLEKIKNNKEKELDKVKAKNILSKLKIKAVNDNDYETVKSDKLGMPTTCKAGPKSKTKNRKVSDPYVFESDSVGDSNAEKNSDAGSSTNSDFETDSYASSRSFGSSEVLSEVKKKTKRKRPRWQAGIIKPKTKKKKVEFKQSEPNTFDVLLPDKMSAPDLNCFTDRNYCFRKNQLTYSCRLCSYNGTDIVLHYRNQHPHVEIPLSRMAPEVAEAAIEQSEEVNFKAISKTSSDKYICIFCYKEFINCKSVMETFFWHIVSTHTGEFKQNCSECINVTDCSFKLHIPPPPEDTNRQLIGYICNKCNFTQISFENLKTHVIVRHDDKQTAVYTINLSAMTKKALKSLMRRSDTELTQNRLDDQVVSNTHDTLDGKVDCEIEETIRTRRFTRKANLTEPTSTIQSKITFEKDDVSEVSDSISETDDINIKTERVESENINERSIQSKEHCTTTDFNDVDRNSTSNDEIDCSVLSTQSETTGPQPCNDIFDYPHFKINISESGSKIYLCCINGIYHFKTPLLISLKKHVQSKHNENWDGYCYVCKVIVTPQGAHKFRDCLQHYLDKHIDNFPILEEEHVDTKTPQAADNYTESLEIPSTSCSPKINIRPLAELTDRFGAVTPDISFPIIQSVTSLGASSVESRLSPYPDHIGEETEEQKIFKYEEHQTEVLSKKYYLIVQEMTSPENLIKVFKCSGRYCPYVTDSAQEALAHAATHQRLGGTDALNCPYCDFDTAGNAIDLVTHVFKIHGSCQYCCHRCFYRAMSSQAVGSHISRVHGGSPQTGSVLRTTAVSSIAPVKSNVLTREQAVYYYTCGHSDNDAPCKFRTYTPDKFCEHLEQRHPASEHPCHTCSIKFSGAAELVRHMKDHGLMLYQCTWCVYGADKESGLLDHISIMHPDKVPQAYIRIITNKEGSSEQRVLPLALLNKYKVPTKDMTPTPTKANPEREAKRSIELEAIVGPIVQALAETSGGDSDALPVGNTPIDNINEIPEVTNEETPIENIDAEIIQTADMSQNYESPVKDKKPINLQTPGFNSKTAVNKVTPLPLPTQLTDNILLPSPTLLDSTETRRIPKKEPADVQKSGSPDVFVVDSEDDVSSAAAENVIEVSDDETYLISNLETQAISLPEKQTISNLEKDKETSKTSKPEIQIISSNILHTCPKCKQVCKNLGGLRKHIFSCPVDRSNRCCPHCNHIAESFEKLILHYIVGHSGVKKSFECRLCGKICFTENYAKKHLRLAHKESNILFTPCENDELVNFFSPGIKKRSETPIEKTAPKRKLSGPKSDMTPVKRKFNPQEIDQLPLNPILDQLVYCSQCEFSTKVRLNMVRHLQLHAEQQPVPQKAPVNPVPHLESNEKHFDKMANLASSSAVNRTPDKPRSDVPQTVTLLMPPELASRYPKYVPERQRHTCGAKGCSYTSVDEAMLRRHWDTLHSGTSDFHCVHCPPQQHLDTTKPLTAIRILSHLKMHDATLYACSACSYYHFKREIVDKHLSEIHKNGRLLVVRETGSSTESPNPVQASSTPTMDLKPWQCGLCKFKTMLHPEVVTHCFKVHQSKMQFKCAYCPFRTSAIENISKHQTNSHAGKPEEVFYYFYREGSIPDETDGTPRWMKQQQKAGPSAEPEVKVEARSSVSPVPDSMESTITPISVDLNLVKKEVCDVQTTVQGKSIDELCNIFGQFCEPNGIKFKCPLCSVMMGDTKEGMQSHLYEELNYRKWSCGLCSYKAFHKAGLTDHMTLEHCRQYDHVELPTNENIEKWVQCVLDYQATIINNHKNNLMKQKIVADPQSTPTKLGHSTVAKPGPSTVAKPGPSTEITTLKETVCKYTDEELQKAFGPFGQHNENMFCCPKCSFLTTDLAIMKDHLETELNKIRWYCSSCPVNYQTYHEAQFHCKSHNGPSRPIEAIRDQNMRAAWVTSAIQKQKSSIQSSPPSSQTSTPEKHNPYSDSDNSLLVVRYEEKVPTPDQITFGRKRPAADSDDEKLIIDEGNTKQKPQYYYCTYCTHKCNNKFNLKIHMLKHFNLKQFCCSYCEFYGSTRMVVSKHSQETHKDKPVIVQRTKLPPQAMIIIDTDVDPICLVCQKHVPNSSILTHLHDNVRPIFSSSVNVLKCACSYLCIDATGMHEHYKKTHPSDVVHYTPYTIVDVKTYECSYCPNNFTEFEDFKTHHMAVHNHLPFKIETNTRSITTNQVKTVSSIRRCAKKSTTKLPNSVAKKSTTKLPYFYYNESDSTNLPYESDSKEEYSFYGNKPSSLEEFSNMTTLMSFCNRLVPFTMTQLSQHLNLEPLVVVTKMSSD